MKRFRNLLVGIKFSSDRSAETEHADAASAAIDRLTPSCQAAVVQAIELARRSGAHVTLVSVAASPAVVDLPLKKQVDRDQRELLREVRQQMERAVHFVREQGVSASMVIRVGVPWVEITQQILENRHDLVLIGKPHDPALVHLLGGQLGLRLLRKAPCPVWLAATACGKVAKILCATDFSPVADACINLGNSLADYFGAELHVLHTVEYPLERSLWFAHVPAEYRNEYRLQAFQQAQSHLADCERQFTQTGRKPIRTHLHSSSLTTAIMQTIAEESIDLLVMGTIARGGVGGFLLGNTAERLAGVIPCSLLSLKPVDFLCPIRLPETQTVIAPEFRLSSPPVSLG